MDVPQRPDQFPCPFCHSGSLLLIGGNRRFHYYRCGECAEIWTVNEACGRRDVTQAEKRPFLMH